MSAGKVPRLLVATLFLTGLATKVARAEEPSPNKMQCIAADTDGQKLRLAGRLAEARKRLAVCAAASCPHIVREDCTQRIDEIEVAQPTVVFTATNGYGRPLVAVHVSVDGKRIVDRLDDRPLAVDPGDHVFLFEALGRVSATMRLSMTEGDRVHHAVVLPTASGARVDEVPEPPVATEGEDQTRADLDVPSMIAPAGSPSGAGEVTAAPEGRGISPPRIAALTLAGVGVAGVVVGGVFGLMTLTTWGGVTDACPHGSCPASEDVQAYQQHQRDERTAATDGNISTVAFVVGAASLGAAAWLWFGAPESTRSPNVALLPAAGPSQGHLFVRARF